MNQRIVEIFVGLFILVAVAALLMLALKVSGLSDIDHPGGYEIRADFDNIGGLKVGAPVTIAGVKLGEVEHILLDPKTFRAKVLIEIFSKDSKLPIDTSASIFTSGILGAQYISLTPGFSHKNLQANGEIETTHSALVLENLIGQLLFHLKEK